MLEIDMSGRESPPLLFNALQVEEQITDKLNKAENALRIQELSGVIYKKLVSFSLKQMQVQTCLYKKLIYNTSTNGLNLFDWPIELLKRFSSQLEDKLNEMERIDSRTLPDSLPPEVIKTVLEVYINLNTEKVNNEIKEFNTLFKSIGNSRNITNGGHFKKLRLE